MVSNRTECCGVGWSVVGYKVWYNVVSCVMGGCRIFPRSPKIVIIAGNSLIITLCKYMGFHLNKRISFV